MILFPNAKINIGLQVTEKRPDGFHNLNTVFVPVEWTDIVEFLENKNYKTGDQQCELKITGLKVSGNTQENLLVRAYNLICNTTRIPPLKVFLHKNIPMGAGLGGGSSDAAFFLKGLADHFQLDLSVDDLKQLASSLGSDCSFFIENRSMYAFEKGDKFKAIDLKLSNYYYIIVYPGVHSDTKIAYSGITPKSPDLDLFNFIQTENVHNWKDHVKNDFEPSVFSKFPVISEIKRAMYSRGAVYASMSGSGSAVFGLFDKDVSGIDFSGENYRIFKGKF